MRLLAVFLFGVLGTVGLRLHPIPQATQAVTVPVQVDVRCNGRSVWFTVDPWTAALNQDDEMEWVLNDSAGSSEITIDPKRGAWPFADSLKYHGGHGVANRPHARHMKPNQHGKHFSYAIQLVCQRTGSGPDTVIVDPQIIIH